MVRVRWALQLLVDLGDSGLYRRSGAGSGH